MNRDRSGHGRKRDRDSRAAQWPAETDEPRRGSRPGRQKSTIGTESSAEKEEEEEQEEEEAGPKEKHEEPEEVETISLVSRAPIEVILEPKRRELVNDRTCSRSRKWLAMTGVLWLSEFQGFVVATSRGRSVSGRVSRLLAAPDP